MDSKIYDDIIEDIKEISLILDNQNHIVQIVDKNWIYQECTRPPQLGKKIDFIEKKIFRDLKSRYRRLLETMEWYGDASVDCLIKDGGYSARECLDDLGLL